MSYFKILKIGQRNEHCTCIRSGPKRKGICQKCFTPFLTRHTSESLCFTPFLTRHTSESLRVINLLIFLELGSFLCEKKVFRTQPRRPFQKGSFMSVLQLLATSILLAIFETIHISPKNSSSCKFFFLSSLSLCFYLLNGKLIY